MIASFVKNPGFPGRLPAVRPPIKRLGRLIRLGKALEDQAKSEIGVLIVLDWANGDQ